MENVLVYIAGPITPKNGYLSEENVLEGFKAHIELVKGGIPNYCPQLVGAFHSAWTEVTWETWMRHDHAIIKRCTHMLMLPNWETSKGACEERHFAHDMGMPIAYSIPELVMLLEK